MPATPMIYTRGILQEYNTNDETWSEFLNQQALQRLDDARGQYTVLDLNALAVAGVYTLTVQNFLPDQARAAVLEFTGTGAFTVNAPSSPYWYIVHNDCTGILTLQPQGGIGVAIRPGCSAIWTSKGTSARIVDLRLDQIRLAAAPVDINGQRLFNGAAGTAATDFATLSNRINQFLAPNAPVDFGSQRATNGADPVASKDLVTKSFMEAAIALLSLVNLPSILGNSNKFLAVNAAGDNVEWRGAGGATSAGAYFTGGW
jgi:hypothetical protein